VKNLELDGIFEFDQWGEKESRLHRRNKGLGKLRFRPFPHRHICAAYFFRVAVFYRYSIASSFIHGVRLAAPINPVPIREKVSIRWDQLFPYFFRQG
jgi:hypothetical protein